MFVITNSGSSTSTTGWMPFDAPQYFTIAMELPSGMRANLTLSHHELARFKRGAELLGGLFDKMHGMGVWDALTPQQRKQYEDDADWLCLKIERLKCQDGRYSTK